MRLREGGELYPALASVDASDVYRYAPWFAWLAVPVTYLPQQLAGALWSVALLGASAIALIPLVRMRAWMLVALFAPILVGVSAVGNVHALVIALLVWGVERRGGPFWIAVAASLKIFPLLLALVYAGRGHWGRFGAAVFLTALLWAPVLFYNLDHYAVEAGKAAALYSVPILYFVAAAAGVGVTLILAPTRWGWLAAATTVVLTLPRLFVYDVSFLMVGAASSAVPVRDQER
jgi:Glycosyltransferase family 87